MNYAKGPALPVSGFTATGIAAGIKKTGAPDLMLIASEFPAAVAGVFTTNVVRAAPVEWSRGVVKKGVCHAVVANSGGANAYTGAQGEADTREMAELVGAALGIPADQVLVASTGVIAQPLPMPKLRAGIPRAAKNLVETGWSAAAEAIRTTDLVAKLHSVTVPLKGRTLTLTGITKGSGMIHPNMATMLGFIATDAPVSAPNLQTALSGAVERTFNRITVDGDTSTNDCVLALANGRAGGPPLAPGSAGWEDFATALETLCDELARSIVADGEGATKLVTVTVRGLASEADALTVARQIATSNLVKTALFGADPNWGRIVAAAGQAGVLFLPERASLSFNHAELVRDGVWLGSAAEKACGGVMAGREYTIALSLGDGPGEASVLTCDFSYDYVRINADYRS
ncbi:MAG: bifunctional glutamate N-acetyltransferase/amino-acid acetyltransferase ArgJ [Nitrospirota bacterium]|nr:bifunctional glutamate N-acetyltransferase/amino-acid acetyltransferase ArgJ [Nitrospirota bacterium]